VITERGGRSIVLQLAKTGWPITHLNLETLDATPLRCLCCSEIDD
jgi:hypothetical protein